MSVVRVTYTYPNGDVHYYLYRDFEKFRCNVYRNYEYYDTLTDKEMFDQLIASFPSAVEITYLDPGYYF